MNLRLRLTARERELICEFGYPFQDVQEQLDRLAATRAARIVHISSYFFDMLLADLSRSEREVKNRRLLAELDELYAELESQALRQGHTVGA